MSKKFTLILGSLLILTIVAAGLAVFAFIDKERESTKRIMVEDKLKESLKDKRAIEKELDLAKKEKEVSDTKIKEMESQAKDLSSQIEQEKNKSKLAMDEVNERKKELSKFQDLLEKERGEKASISKKLEELESNYDKAKKDIARMKDEKDGMVKEIDELRQKAVRLDKIIVSQSAQDQGASTRAGSASIEPLKGRVLVVNREYNFVVVDIGEVNGVKKDMIFEIKGEGASLGKVKVDKVYESMSSAIVLPGTLIDNIKKGNPIIESF